MATYNKNKPKSNVAKSAKKSSLKFKWWMAVVGVGIIALIGIVVLRFSHAGTNDVVGKMGFEARDGRFYAYYWACRDYGNPFTTVLVSYRGGSNIKETYTSLWIHSTSDSLNSYYHADGHSGSTLISIKADMRVTNYLRIEISRLRPDKHASSNTVRVGTIPYCN